MVSGLTQALSGPPRNVYISMHLTALLLLIYSKGIFMGELSWQPGPTNLALTFYLWNVLLSSQMCAALLENPVELTAQISQTLAHDRLMPDVSGAS